MIWIGRFLFDWSIILGCFLSVYHFGWWAVWPAGMIMGFRIHALHEIAHLASHRLIFRNKFDDIISHLIFLPQGVDLKKYRKFHLTHHRHVGDPSLDPESIIQHKFRRRWIKPRVIDTIKDAFGLTLDETFVTLREISTDRSILVFVSLIGIFFALFGPVVFVWIVAMITGLPVAHRLRAQTEHQHITNPGSTLYKIQPSLWKRMVFLPHNVWQHYEHHNLKC